MNKLFALALLAVSCAASAQGYYGGNPNYGYQPRQQAPANLSFLRQEGCVLIVRNNSRYSQSVNEYSLNLRWLEGLDVRNNNVVLRSRSGSKTATFYTPQDAHVAASQIRQNWEACSR